MESNQDLYGSTKAPSEGATVTSPPSHIECDCHRKPPRHHLRNASLILNLAFIITGISTLIILSLPHSHPTFYPSSSTNTSTTIISTVTSSQPTITPHAGRRRSNPYTTCLLGPTQADITSFMGIVNPRVYFGQTCAQVHQEGDMPYEFNYVYEISVAPPPSSSKRSEGPDKDTDTNTNTETETETLEKRRELSSSPENVNDGFSGKEHPHWHPKTDKQRENIEAGVKGMPPWVEFVEWVRAVGRDREFGMREG